MTPLVAEIIEVPEGLVVRIAGEAGTDVSPMDRQFTRLLAQRPKVLVIDVSGLSFCSSLGMGLLMALRRDMGRCGCKVSLAGLQPIVLESFTRARVTSLFDLHPTVDAALGR